MDTARAAEIAMDRDTEAYHRPSSDYEEELQLKVDRLDSIIANLIKHIDSTVEAEQELEAAYKAVRESGYTSGMTDVHSKTGVLQARVQTLQIARDVWAGDY